MAKIIINNNEDDLEYLEKSDSYANLENVLDEWIRFLSYIKPEELLQFNDLSNKKNLTVEERKQYFKIKKQKEMAELFVKYKNRTCTKEEHDQVFEFMDNSLESFMIDRLTEDEMDKSYIVLNEFEQIEESKLDEYIEKQNDNYDNLSIFEAYILYKVKEIRYNKVNDDLNNKISYEQKSREISLRRNLIKDFGLRK